MVNNIALSLSVQTQALPVWGISLNETTFILCGTTFFFADTFDGALKPAQIRGYLLVGGESGGYATTTKFRLSVGDLLKVSHHKLSEMTL